MPGNRFQYHTPPKSPAISITRTPSTPAFFRYARTAARQSHPEHHDLDVLIDRVTLGRGRIRVHLVEVGQVAVQPPGIAPHLGAQSRSALQRVLRA
jgi:hypothetical protein